MGLKVVSVAPRRSRLSSCSLPRFALPSHPFVLARIEHAVAVKEEEAVGSWGRAVAAVQLLDRLSGGREQMRIAFQNLLVGVDPVRKEGEAEIAAGAGEVMDLQSFDLLQKVGFAG